MTEKQFLEETREEAPAEAPVPAPVPPEPESTVPESTVPESAPPAPKPAVRKGRIAAIAGSALLAVALIGGVGYTVVTVNGADRDAGAPTWKWPEAASKPDAKAPTAKGLSGTLVPYASSGYVRGPDIEQFGSEAELSGREATALRKQEISGLPRSQRLLLEKQIDREQIKGLAMRSYLNVAGATDSTVEAAHAYTIDVQLAQMDEHAVRNIATYQDAVLNALTVFRKGPAVPGHKNARCVLPTKEAGEKLTGMICSAYEGDVLVTLTASGTSSMDSKGIASFLREQLDRIKTTGTAV
ncbi:hypothetical protein [Streptomyces sp. NPDC005423]|uniref:hypothetical protein n=1 Tax=Streptomyces sp. NPDC005423 TaxID=3155343 RepID=UPI0033A1BCEC